MKKALILGGVLTLISSLPASAQIVVQPTIVTRAEPVYVVPDYPVYYDHHHRYDWHYWHHEHDARDWGHSHRWDHERGHDRDWDREGDRGHDHDWGHDGDRR